MKIFRKIRQQLLSENKFIKYLLYAIGEIVLVVIGILIALNFNTNIETKKKESKAVKYLTEIHQGLSLDIQKCNRVIEFFQRKDSLLNLVLTDQMTFEKYKSANREMFILGLNYYPFSIDNNGFTQLMHYSDDLPEKYESLITPLKKIYTYGRIRMESDEQSISNYMDPFYMYLDQNTTWQSDLIYMGKLPDDAINFYLNDPYYRNYLIGYHTRLIKNQYITIHSFRFNSEKIYNELTNILGLDNIVTMDSSYYKLNYEDYVHFVGTYMDSINTATISLESNKFVYKWNDEEKVDLIPLSTNSFAIPNSSKFNRIYYDSISHVFSYHWHYGRYEGILQKIK